MGDNERFRQFCIGQHEAFVTRNIGTANFPSAYAIGYEGGDAMPYLLASKHALKNYGNPLNM